MNTKDLIKFDITKLKHKGKIGLFVPKEMRPVQSYGDQEGKEINAFPVLEGAEIWYKPQPVLVKVYNEVHGQKAIWIEGTF